MNPELERQERATAWELRTAWAKRYRVALALADICTVPRISGTVEYVSVSNAYALIKDGPGEPLHVPCAYVLSIRRPHFTEPHDQPPRAKPEDPHRHQLRLRVAGVDS